MAQRAAQHRKQLARLAASDVVEPDGRQLDGVLIAVKQLAGKERVLPDGRSEGIDHGVQVGSTPKGWHSLPRQRHLSFPAVMIRAEEDHQVRGAHRFGRFCPHAA